MAIPSNIGEKCINCSVCGAMFVPSSDRDHYVVDCGDGKLMDAFDCPKCGCQVRVNDCYPVYPTKKARVTYRRYDGSAEKHSGRYPWHIEKEIHDTGRYAYWFNSVKDFTKALNDIYETFQKKGYITVAEYKKIIGDDTGCIDDRYSGWYGITNLYFGIGPGGEGFVISMPDLSY